MFSIESLYNSIYPTRLFISMLVAPLKTVFTSNMYTTSIKTRRIGKVNLHYPLFFVFVIRS